MMTVHARPFAIPLTTAILGALLGPVPLGHAQPAQYKRTGTLTLLTDNGGRLDWSPDGEWIYFDRSTGGSCFKLYRVKPDGTQESAISGGFSGAAYNHGNPAVHPNGRFLVFQAAEPTTGCGNDPGRGADHSLWLMTGLDDGNYGFHRLTSVTSESKGVLHAQFSHDGTKLFWTEDHGAIDLDWRLVVADFVTGTGGAPPYSLANVCRFEPTNTNGRYYESHGFGPDDDWIYFSCSRPTTLTATPAWDMCRSPVPQFQSQPPSCPAPAATALTTTSGEEPEVAAWDEHAHLSPIDDDVMVWMTSYPRWLTGPDLWLMKANGDQKAQLTFFNLPETLFNDYEVVRRVGTPDVISCDHAVASDSAWHPDGTRIALRVEYGGCEEEDEPEHIWIVDLTYGEGPALEWVEPDSNAAATGGDGNGWESNPAGAADHGTSVAKNDNGVQDSHVWFDYDISIPPGAVIDGIEVRVDWKSDGSAWGPKLQVALSSDGGSTWTAQKTTATGDANFQVDILGGPADTWGRSWSPSDVGNFRVKVRASCSNESLCNGRDYVLDWLPVKVTYH
jgi:hypothetical protein